LQHRSTTAPSVLEKFLGRQCKLRVKNAEPSEPFVPGTVYVARTAEHLIVGTERVDAEHAAWAAPGFREVDDRLVVTPALA
jgi:chemotaxis response regulator CheB